ncbi:hypothetical protein ACU5DF_00665 [Aliivibrio wodanis]|uniref:hypothetical protein n=1 Tax=Aliivibrio wodanis TaxID=80852 RepID=UPI00406CCF9A
MNLKIEEIKNLIEENNIDEIKKIIIDDINNDINSNNSIIDILINYNYIKIITFICDNLLKKNINEEINKNIIYNLHSRALKNTLDDGINETSAYILSKIFHHPKKEELYINSLEFTDSEQIRNMCKCSHDSENIVFIKILHEAEIESDWGLILLYSCIFGQRDMVDYIMNNFELSNETISESLKGVITSEIFGPFSDDPDQIYIISKLIKSNKVNVNIDGEEWNYLYFDCLICAPAAAKYFYTPEFESGCINSENFWEELLDDVNTDDEKSLYMDALVDLKNSDVNTDGLISIFKKLNQPDLVTILSNDQSQ